MATVNEVKRYLNQMLESVDLETLFEHFGLDPEEVFLQLWMDGELDLGQIVDDELVESQEDDES